MEDSARLYKLERDLADLATQLAELRRTLTPELGWQMLMDYNVNAEKPWLLTWNDGQTRTQRFGTAAGLAGKVERILKAGTRND